MSARKEVMRQLMDLPEFHGMFKDIESGYFEQWFQSETLEEREKLHLKVGVLREVMAEIQSLGE